MLASKTFGDVVRTDMRDNGFSIILNGGTIHPKTLKAFERKTHTECIGTLLTRVEGQYKLLFDLK